MRLIFVSALSLLLMSCGFRPLYEAGGSADAMRAYLATVEVAPIPDRLGQIMHNQLMDRLNANSADFRLNVSLEQNTRGFGLRDDASVSQEELTITARMTLVKLDGEEVVIEEAMRARTAYDVVLSDFATLTQREDSARRLVLDLAERIERRLALYFSERGGA